MFKQYKHIDLENALTVEPVQFYKDNSSSDVLFYKTWN